MVSNTIEPGEDTFFRIFISDMLAISKFSPCASAINTHFIIYKQMEMQC